MHELKELKIKDEEKLKEISKKLEQNLLACEEKNNQLEEIKESLSQKILDLQGDMNRVINEKEGLKELNNAQLKSLQDELKVKAEDYQQKLSENEVSLLKISFELI